MGVPNNYPNDVLGQKPIKYPDDMWWGGCIVHEPMDIDFNRRCKECYNTFKVEQ